jgi:hypothetical protein
MESAAKVVEGEGMKKGVHVEDITVTSNVTQLCFITYFLGTHSIRTIHYYKHGTIYA